MTRNLSNEAYRDVVSAGARLEALRGHEAYGTGQMIEEAAALAIAASAHHGKGRLRRSHSARSARETDFVAINARYEEQLRESGAEGWT